MIRRPPRSTLFPTRRSSDLSAARPGSGATRRALVMVDTAAAVLEHTPAPTAARIAQDRKSTRLNSSHITISYAVFCLKKKKKKKKKHTNTTQRTTPQKI